MSDAIVIKEASDDMLVDVLKHNLGVVAEVLDELQKRNITVQLDLAGVDNGSGTVKPVLALRGVWKNMNPNLIMRVK